MRSVASLGVATHPPTRPFRAPRVNILDISLNEERASGENGDE